MSEYVCPECGMGFLEKRGKVVEWVELEPETWLEKLCYFSWCFVYGVPKRTEIHCPGCEHVLVDSESNE